jgi:uncharacterized protein YjbI with pentapeptide repeats
MKANESVRWPIGFGLLAGLLAGAGAYLVDATLGVVLPTAFIAGLAGVGFGLLHAAPDRINEMSKLGAGLLLSAVIGGCLAWTQYELNRHLASVQNQSDRRLRLAERQREAQAERRHLALLVGLQRDLQGIDLEGRDLRGLYFGKKQLSDANLAHARLDGGVLTEANLRGADLRGAHLVKVDLGPQVREVSDDTRSYGIQGADLTDANFTNADLREAEMFSTHGRRVIFSHANLCKASMIGANFRDASFYEAGLYGVVIPESLRSADLRGTDLRRASLSGTDLREARLSGARLEGATYDDQTKWPKGFDPVKAGARYDARGGFGTADGPCPAVPRYLSRQRQLDEAMSFRCIRFLDKGTTMAHNPGTTFRWPSMFGKPIAQWKWQGAGARPRGRGWRLVCANGLPEPHWSRDHYMQRRSVVRGRKP